MCVYGGRGRGLLIVCFSDVQCFFLFLFFFFFFFFVSSVVVLLLLNFFSFFFFCSNVDRETGCFSMVCYYSKIRYCDWLQYVI